jgi:hypothetical protein
LVELLIFSQIFFAISPSILLFKFPRFEAIYGLNRFAGKEVGSGIRSIGLFDKNLREIVGYLFLEYIKFNWGEAIKFTGLNG